MLRTPLFALASALAALVIACTPTAPQGNVPTQPTSTTPPAPAPTASADPAPAPSKAGAEGAICGGLAGFGCAPSLYCSFTLEAHCGAADMTGICRAAPEVCTQEFAPVCGCNDQTYPNACHAARAKVSVGSNGECAAPPALAEGQTCGTRGVRGECATGLYCAFGADCGHTDRGGTCQKKPQVCTRIYAPVCGCDGKTHGSACTAASAGVSIAAQGECKP